MKLELEINDRLLEYKSLTEFDVKMMIGVAFVNKVKAFNTEKTAQIIGLDYKAFAENVAAYGKPDPDFFANLNKHKRGE